MNDTILHQLEERVESMIETIELLRLQVEELESKNARLLDEANTLKNKQNSWEKNLSQMIQKMDILEAKATQETARVVTEEVAS
mgnify:CR=1 FL=1